MPLIRSAKKKMRKDIKRTAHNREIETALKGLIKQTRQKPSSELLTKTFSALDKAVKINLIHANKASRLKSRISKLVSPSKTS